MKKTPKTCDYDYWTVGEGFRWLKGEYTHVCMFVCSRACVDVCVHACYVIVCDSKKNVSTGRQCDLLCESGLWSQGGGEWWGGWLTPSTTPWWQGARGPDIKGRCHHSQLFVFPRSYSLSACCILLQFVYFLYFCKLWFQMSKSHLPINKHPTDFLFTK